MAEVKTGLEGTLGWLSEVGTLGKVYYNALTGSAGTRNAGIGTSATTGANKVYWGSAFVNCSGVWVHVAQGTATVGSAGAETVCKSFEVGSDGTVTMLTGGTAANVAAAIAARTGTTAGKAPLGYVTVGTGGSVLAGSIVDERTFSLSTAISYVTSFEYSQDMSVMEAWDRKTFAHYKPGRPKIKASIKELYVNNGSMDVWPTSSTYHTVPTVALELAIDGVSGTMENALLLQRCAKDSSGVNQPEDDLTTAEISVLAGSLSSW